MGWLDKLFGNEPSAPDLTVPTKTAPAIFEGLEGIRFGRYTDTNKTYEKTKSWFLADDHFKSKEYPAAFAAFFDFIRDEAEDNILFVPEGNGFKFELVQGSKKLIGSSDGTSITARVSIVKMEKPSNAAMRRLLELNYVLYYAHCALDPDQILCMLFDTPVEMASPARLYYAFREMSIFADQQDDLLVADFSALKPVDTGHLLPMPEPEIEVKFKWFRKWIQEALDQTKDLNPDSFSGAIAYIYLSLLYRIDFLIVPQRKLQSDLDAINTLYWTRKDEVPIVERNSMMKEGITKLLDISREDFQNGMYRAKGTFSVNPLVTPDKLRENIVGANNDAAWYIDNKYPALALLINEYGIVYNQYAFSQARILTELSLIYMAVVHADFFKDLGLLTPLVNESNGLPDQERIIQAINETITKWQEKFVALQWDHSKINYSTVWDFARSFSDHLQSVNLEVKR